MAQCDRQPPCHPPEPIPRVPQLLPLFRFVTEPGARSRLKIMIGASVVDSLFPCDEREATQRDRTDGCPRELASPPVPRRVQDSRDIANDPAQEEIEQLEVTAATATGTCVQLPPYPLSFLESVEPEAKRLVVLGPHQSGLSSLLLDLACSLASRDPCRCDPPPISLAEAAGTTTATAPSRSLPPLQCRGCTAILIFRPAREAGRRTSAQHQHPDHHHQQHQQLEDEDPDPDPFPMTCHPLEESVDANTHYECQHDGHQQSPSAASETSPSKGHPDERSEDCDHDSAMSLLLRRIKIFRVADLRDVRGTLLRMQGWAEAAQPLGGILVDDLDRIAVSSADQHRSAADASSGRPGPLRNHSQSAASALSSSPSRVTELVALLVDTVQVLQRKTFKRLAPTQPQSPIRLVLASHTAGGRHLGLRQWTHFWQPTCVELVPARARPCPSLVSRLFQWKGPGRPPPYHGGSHRDDQFPLAASPAIASARHWTACLHRLSPRTEALRGSCFSHHYFILARDNGDGRILWMVSATKESE